MPSSLIHKDMLGLSSAEKSEEFSTHAARHGVKQDTARSEARPRAHPRDGSVTCQYTIGRHPVLS